VSTEQTDIVERLRADAKIQSIVRASLEDAADEIERLRAALKYVAGLPNADPLTGQLAVTAARAALKGAKPCREILSWCRLASRASSRT
jgi:hypothetical protein